MNSTASATEPFQRLHFGPAGRFELDARERRLRIEGQPAALGARAFDLLLTLARQPHRLLTKSELMDAVWSGAVVEESNLQVQMSTLRKLLGGEVIATVPGRGYRFAAEVKAVQVTPGATPAPAAAPQATPPLPAAPQPRLVGRDGDLAAFEAHLQRARCVSLVGPGGVGKTSLARVMAARFGETHVWVDLAAVTDAGQVGAVALRACGEAVGEGDPLPQLVNALGAMPLLVLDNAEHLVDAVTALVDTLLAQLPQLRVLVTTQIALQAASEVVHRLDPLPLAAEDGAQALLAQRINDADNRVRLDATERPLLDAICRQLDGLPLALEMAAARVPVLGLKRVHDELARRFALLTTGRRGASARHRSLHGALDWSYGLLGAEEQRLFRALGLYAGGFTLDLAVAQMDAEGAARWEVIDGLALLVDRSLVVVSAGDPPRYRLLETMRAYALEQLAALGEEDAARRRQGQVLLALLRYGEDDKVPSTPERRAEIENVGAALPWLLQHDFAAAVELCTWSSQHDTFTRWLYQSSYWMEAMEPRLRGAEGDALPQAVRLGWWSGFARALVIRENQRATEVARHACMLAREAGHAERLQNALGAFIRSHTSLSAEGAAACAELEALMAAHPAWRPRRKLATLGALGHWAGLGAGDAASQLALRQQELALVLELGDHAAADAVRTNILQALYRAKRFDEMLPIVAEMLPRLEQQGNVNLPWTYGNYLDALFELGRLDEFDAVVPRALANAWQVRHFLVLEAVMLRLTRDQRLHDVARVAGLLQRLEGQGNGRWSNSPQAQQQLAALQAALGDTTLQRLCAEGAALDAAALQALVLAHGRVQA